MCEHFLALPSELLHKKNPGKIHYSICIKKGLNTEQWMGFESVGGTYWSNIFTIQSDNTFRQFDASFILQMYLVFLVLNLKKHCVHILLQFWGRDNCYDEKCKLHILYSKAAFSITPLTISLDRNTSILELWNWSLTKSFANCLVLWSNASGIKASAYTVRAIGPYLSWIGNQIHVLWGALPRTQILWGACTQMQLWLHRAPHAPGIKQCRCSDSLCTFDGWACPLRRMSLASFSLSFFSGTSILM